MGRALAFLMLPASWLAMQWVHEAGHVLAGWATGGRIERVVLDPFTISRTEVAMSSDPLVVVWAGPLFGSIAPVIAWLLAQGERATSAYLFRFFAGFCCVANGAYLGVGSFDRVGDCGDLLSHGASLWQLWFFGAVSCTVGLRLWHGLAAEFRNEDSSQRTRQGVAVAALCVGMSAAGRLMFPG